MTVFIGKDYIEVDCIENHINEKIESECRKYDYIRAYYVREHKYLYITGKKKNLYNILYFITNEFCEEIERVF